MKIVTNAKVKIEYTLKNDSGEILDSSEGAEPLAYIQGIGALIPGLEKALEGNEEGESISVSINPAEAYGEYDDNLVFDVPKESFKSDDPMSEGMQVQAEKKNGSLQMLTIKAVGKDTVTLDGNHPLAGETLHFDVQVAFVGEATQEELDHGHAH